MNDEPRDESHAAAEGTAFGEESRRAPLETLASPLAADDPSDLADEEDLTGTGEWSLEQETGAAAETAVWKPDSAREEIGSAHAAESRETHAGDAAFAMVDEESAGGEESDDEQGDSEPGDEELDDEESEDEPAVAESVPADAAEPANIDWYILKVASNREESIKDGLLRRARIAGLDHFIKEIIVPTETISEYKNGKRRTRKQKVWPGYLVVHMEINEETWFLVRETPGIGDFTGAAGKPSPMLKEEVEKILRLVRPTDDRKKEKEVEKHVIPYKPGDKVKIKEGTFMDFEGEVESVDQAKSSVTVMINIFGRPTPAEVSSWQLESL